MKFFKQHKCTYVNPIKPENSGIASIRWKIQKSSSTPAAVVGVVFVIRVASNFMPSKIRVKKETSNRLEVRDYFDPKIKFSHISKFHLSIFSTVAGVGSLPIAL